MSFSKRLSAILASRGFVCSVCLLMAIALWHYINVITNHSEVYEVPVVLSWGSVTNGIVTSGTLQTVSVKLTGSSEDLNAITPTAIKCTVPLDSPPSRTTHVFSPADFSFPGKTKIRLDVISPKDCTVSTDVRETKSVKVELDRQNTLPDGYEEKDCRFTPISVEISGPSARLEQLKALSTVPFDLNGVTRSISNHRIALNVPANCALSPEVVTLDFSIVASEIETNLPPMPISVLAPLERPLQIGVSPTTAVLRIRGRLDAVNQAAHGGAIAFVDASDIAASMGTRPVKAILPPNVSVVSADPSFATITLQDVAQP